MCKTKTRNFIFAHFQPAEAAEPPSELLPAQPAEPPNNVTEPPSKVAAAGSRLYVSVIMASGIKGRRELGPAKKGPIRNRPNIRLRPHFKLNNNIILIIIIIIACAW